MKKIKISRAAILIAAVFVLLSFKVPEVPVVGEISFPLGNVLVYEKGKTRATKATFKMPLHNGDKIETKKTSRCEMKFKDGSVVRIDEQTIYTIDHAQFKEKEKQVEASLSLGRLWANVKKLFSRSDSWKLKSPAAVVAVRGTIYRMDAAADSSTTVRVYEGNVAVSPPVPPSQQQGMGVAPGKPQQVAPPTQVQGPKQVSVEQWIEIIKAQQQIVVRPDGSYTKSDFDMQQDAESEWVKWNQERDKLLQQ